MQISVTTVVGVRVALRKESVDRNAMLLPMCLLKFGVALRKESVDRNLNSIRRCLMSVVVALRKESVDRNGAMQIVIVVM